jgi:DNA-binding XRE family transcriptional regulator
MFMKEYRLVIRNKYSLRYTIDVKGLLTYTVIEGVNFIMLITLRAARANLGLTRKEAAKLFDIHYLTLKNYEADSSRVPRSFFIKIESIYGISTESIYFGKEEDHYFSARNKLEVKHA